MKRSPSKSEAAELRRRAEERLGRRKAELVQDVGADPRRLVHDLEVHQIELEMQNEELRSARLEIEAGLRRYTELFDFAPIGYFTLTSDGTIREVNLAGARLLGNESRWLVGARFGLFVSQGDLPAFNDFLVRVLTQRDKNPTGAVFELELRREAGEPRKVRLSATALEGSERTALVAMEDVTLLRLTEAKVREESHHKDVFLAALSHELRNPLAPIRNSIYVLERAEPGGKQAREAQAVIDRQVHHLTRIVDDLLDINRIARGKIHLERELIELGGLVRRTMNDHRPVFEASGILLEARFSSGLFWLDGDNTRLVQVLGNLLGNAAKFTLRGGKVEVLLRREGRMVALSVRDTGVGIAPEVRERLFEPFQQAPQSLDRTRGGLGLGLATVKGLVELHGGTVQVTSEGLGKGATFIVRLPLAAAPEQAALPAEGRPIQSCRHRVLVVEDNVDAADSLAEALRLDGQDVRVAYDGPTALPLARKFRPEVVICDIGLPGMDGYEVARALSADDATKDSFLIALTGYALPEDLQLAVEAGFDRHIAKPPSMEDLVRLFPEAPAATKGGNVWNA